MTRDQAEALLMKAEGRLCVRFYKRRDGSVITQDCPVGWARVKERARIYATAAFSLFMALLSGVFVVSLFSKQKATVGTFAMPFATPTPQRLMGAVSVNSQDRPETDIERPFGEQVLGKIPVKRSDRN